MKAKRKPAPPKNSRRAWLIGAIVALGVAGAAVYFFRDRAPAPREQRVGAAPVIPPEAEVFAQYAGTESCRACHQEAHALWSASHHGLAERSPVAALDATAFEPARTFKHGTQTSETRMRDGKYEVVAKGFGAKSEPYAIERVIGHDPLRQYLVGAPGGRLQTLEASYDPHRNEWFNVYGGEDRQPGEWGHWTGRGMNWNTMCASCHNTRVRKNYDAATDSYRTTMAVPTVSCESCHGPMKSHVDWRHAYPGSKEAEPTARKLTRDQMFDACGSCHARRSDITGDFHPGEKFSDHYALTVVDESDTYFADGQVSGENYEYGSFLGSKMHAAGVRCVDCHEPHSAKTRAPGNALCLTCHAGAVPAGITKIPPALDPVAHSHHAADSAGAQCTSCHMPITTYMQRYPRHDHGFTIPDPLLTKEYGIPNACNRCHADKDADWSLAAVEQWYGGKMQRPTRERAWAVAGARHGNAAARSPLLAVAQDDASPFWQASAAQLLTQWIAEPQVSALFIKQTLHPNPLVRANATRALERIVAARPDAREFVSKLLDDTDRSVRVAAAWALSDTIVPGTRAFAELEQHMTINADQPTGQMQIASFQNARGNPAGAVDHLRRAVEWDGNSPPIRHDFAVALSAVGDNAGAIEQLEAAVRLDPKQEEFHYKLALAYNESGRLDRTITELQETVKLAPTYARAWYNLGLAHHSMGHADQAIAALTRGEAAAPLDASIPYARATILARLGRVAEARQAAQRALEIQPGYSDARALLQNLGQ